MSEANVSTWARTRSILTMCSRPARSATPGTGEGFGRPVQYATVSVAATTTAAAVVQINTCRTVLPIAQLPRPSYPQK